MTTKPRATEPDPTDQTPVLDRHETRMAMMRAPFPPEEISRLPRGTCKACSDSPRRVCDKHTWVGRCQMCGGSHSSAAIHLDFVGHADLTNRLLDVDPDWTWEPVAWGADGLPVLDSNGGLWIRLTVDGTTRYGYGDRGNSKGANGVKEAIGDALRNAAMRFGAALALWAKGDRDWNRAESGRRDSRLDEYAEAAMNQEWLTEKLARLADQAHMPVEEFTHKMRAARDGLDHAGALVGYPPEAWAEFLVMAEDHLRADQVARALDTGGGDYE